MRRLGAGLARELRCPVAPLPVDQVRRRLVGHAFPPDVAFVGERDVGEDRVVADARHAVGVRLLVRTRRDAEVARLWVDRVKPPVLAGLDPGDVVADRRHLPPGKRRRRDEHREVGLAARARERRGDMVLAAARRLDAEDQHVLGEPARPAVRGVGCVAAHPGGDAQGEALLAEQRIAAVARAVAPDLLRLGVVDDVLDRVARPRHVLLAGGERRADRMHARHEMAVAAEQLEHAAAHSRHDLHAHCDVGAVGQLDADVRDLGAERTHRERNDVHRAAAHAAAKERRRSVGKAVLEDRAHLGGRFPVVGRPGVFLALGADEGSVLDPGDVARAAAREIAARPQHRIEPDEGSGGDELLGEALVLGGAAVAPVDVARLGQGGHFGDPLDQPGVTDMGRRADDACGGGKTIR